MARDWWARLKRKPSSLPVAASVNPPPPIVPSPSPPNLPAHYSTPYDGPPPPTPRNFRSFSHDQQQSKSSDFAPRLPSVKSATFNGGSKAMGNTTAKSRSPLHAPSLPTLREVQPTEPDHANERDIVKPEQGSVTDSSQAARSSQDSYTPLYPPLPSAVDLGRSVFSNAVAGPSSSKNPFLALSSPPRSPDITKEFSESHKKKETDKEQPRFKTPDGKRLKDIMDGKEVVVSHPGSSQYMAQGSGSSACGLAALNCVRLVFAKAKEGLAGEDLIMYTMLQQTTDEVLSICRYWSNNIHLDVEDIAALAIFRRSIHLNRTHFGIPTGEWFEHVLTYLQEIPEAAVAVITRPPEIIACFRIPTPKSDVYLIFDSHPRPLHPRGAGFVFSTSPTETAKRLASILAFDATLVEDPSMQWQAQLLVNCSSHIFTTSSVATSDDMTQDLLEMSMASLLTKGQATEIRELKRDKERLEVALRGQQERRATLGQQLDDLALANSSLRDQYSDAGSMLTSLRKENERLLSDRRRREEQHTEIVTAHLNAIDSLNETIQQLRQQVEITDLKAREKSKSGDSPGAPSHSRLLNVSTTAVAPSSAEAAEEEDFPSTSSRPAHSSPRAHPAQVSATSLLAPRTSSRTASGSKDKDGPNFILTSIALSPSSSKTRSASEPHSHLSINVNHQQHTSPTSPIGPSSPNNNGHVKSAGTPVRSTITLPPPRPSAPSAITLPPLSAVLRPVSPPPRPSCPPPLERSSSARLTSPTPVASPTPIPIAAGRAETKSTSPPPTGRPVPRPRPQAGPSKPRPHTYFDTGSSTGHGASSNNHTAELSYTPLSPLVLDTNLKRPSTASGSVDKNDKALPLPPASPMTASANNAVLGRRRTSSRTSPINETNRFSVIIKEPLVSPKDKDYRPHVLHKEGGNFVRGVKSARELRSPIMPGSWSEPETPFSASVSKEKVLLRARERERERDKHKDRDREREKEIKERDGRNEGKEREVVTDTEVTGSKLLKKERSIRRMEGERRLDSSEKGKERESAPTRTKVSTPPEVAERHRLSRILEDPTPPSTLSKGNKEKGKEKAKEKERVADRSPSPKGQRSSPDSLASFAQGLINTFASGKASSTPAIVATPTKVSALSHHQSLSAATSKPSSSSLHGHHTKAASISKLHSSASSSTIHGSYSATITYPVTSREEATAMRRPRHPAPAISYQQSSEAERDRIRKGLVASELHFQAHQKLAQSQYQSQSQSQLQKASQSQPPTQKAKAKTFECRICFDEHPLDDIARVDGCNHVYCRECLRGYIVEGIKARKYPIRCPVCVTVKDMKYPGVIGDLLVQLIGVPESTYAVYIEMQLSPFSILVTCRRCKNSAYVDREEHNATKLIPCPSPDCSYTWCRMCNQEVRPAQTQTHSCDGTSELKALAKQQGWKNCPGCQATVQKTEGCNHMACTAPGCNAHFCYLCGGMIHRGQRQADIEAAVSRHFRGQCQLFFVPTEPGRA